jgi:hypothetical protein
MMYKKTTDLAREEWNNLRYPIRLKRCSGEEGGGWIASIPMLGEAGFVADGEPAREPVGIPVPDRRYAKVASVAGDVPLPVHGWKPVPTKYVVDKLLP